MAFVYYKVSFKLFRPMLGTATAAPIYAEHIIAKSKRLIKEANETAKKMSKALAKYKGTEFSDEKGVAELQGIIRHIQALSGIAEPGVLPTKVDEVLELWESLSKELRAQLEDGETSKETIFLKDVDGHPVVSTHMVLGNLKEIAKNLTNNGDDTFKSKTSIGEIFSTDLKPVEEFMWPSMDIIRHTSDAVDPRQAESKFFSELIQGGRLTKNEPSDAGKARLFERPLRGITPQGPRVAIARSEILPSGSEMACTLRVREGSPITEEVLHRLFDMGKNCGLGQWRGSGNMGAYRYNLEALPNYKEDLGKEFDGWL